MKKLKSKSKLNLNKKTVSRLNEKQLAGIKGGCTGLSMCKVTATDLCQSN